ncbi:MAG: TonB-dependent receptor [Bacteroidota bacterium]
MMMRTILSVLLAVLVSGAPAVMAQDTTRTALPDIAPREVEIRGQLEISLPSLRRQPLVGFNPPPRITEIPAGRRPFIERYKQESIDLPPSPLQPPEPPEVSSLANRIPFTGTVDGGLGTYLHRFGSANVGLPVGLAGRLNLEADYRGQRGDQPFADRRNQYDRFFGRLGYEQTATAAIWGVEGDFGSHALNLFGANPTGGIIVEEPTRTLNTGGGAFYVRALPSALTQYAVRAAFGGTSIDTATPPVSSLSDISYDEQRFELDGALTLPFGTNAFIADAEFATSSLDDVIPDNSFAGLSVGSMLRFRPTPQTEVNLGGRFMTDRSTARGVSGEEEARPYFAPIAQVLFYPQQGVRVYVQTLPSATLHSFREMTEVNPYVVPRPRLEATVRTVDAEAGADVFVGALRIKGFVGYQLAPNYRFFEAGGAGERELVGLIAARYERASIVHGGAEVSAALPRGIYGRLSTVLRRARLTEGDTVVPYVSPFEVRAQLSYMFDRQRGLLQIGSTFQGRRYRDRAETFRVGDFFDLDVEASYLITPTMAVLLQAGNLSIDALNVYDVYPITPFVITGGLRFRW